MHRIEPAVKLYDWGNGGACERFAAPQEKKIAELWFGTHPSGPARLRNPPGASLTDVVVGGEIPCLVKILSVAKCLSIQMHPSKEDAEHLHRSMPCHYPDPNDKPEMAIALGHFEAFCGFRDIQDIQERFLDRNPEVSQSLHDNQGEKAAIRQLVATLLEIDDATYDCMVSRAASSSRREDQILIDLTGQYPGDRGVFIAAYLMNHVVLSPGESICIFPNTPHAYYKGDALEMMRQSDNVVRLGLTPKFRDLPTFFRLAEFAPMRPSVEAAAASYAHPMIPGCIVRFITPGCEKDETILEGFVGIVLVLGGSGDLNRSIPVHGGMAFFAPSPTTVSSVSSSSSSCSEGSLVLAAVEMMMPSAAAP